jgi:choline kinase
VRPDDTKSPLLQPANKHKQLIVIDFEYAAANTPGLEFANHFSEWCYDYHDAKAPHSCRDTLYPSIEEQHRFIRSYVDHRPQFPLAGSTPKLTPLDSNTPQTMTPSLQPTASSSSIVEFMLDARGSSYSNWREEERAREERTEETVQKFLKETQLLRAANSAQWVAWGIIQAKLPGDEVEENDLEADEFDYICYAQERAYLFWGDCVQLGLVKEEELPEKLRGLIKVLNR